MGQTEVQHHDAQTRDAKAAGRAPSQSGRTELAVNGLTCSGCVRNVTNALQAVPGVAHAKVRLEEGRATVRWQPSFTPDENALTRAVSNAGYEASVVKEIGTEPARSEWSPFSGWRFNVVFGPLVTVPLMVAEWVFHVGMERGYHWAAFAAVLPLQILGGARFYKGAWNQLKAGSSNMDTLVVLGSTTAFLYSAWGVLSGWSGHLFFMESAAIITLISVGHWIEGKVSARAANSLRALLNLAPPTARLLGEDGFEHEVPVSQLEVGDRFVLKPGDRVPIDGEVIEGMSAVDESMLTGESTPIDKVKGARVLGGTINLHGWLLAKVIATGEATALAQIIAVVERAQNSRAEIQKLGDRVSSIFVPIVVLIAIATGLWWGFAPASALVVSQWLEGFLWPAHHPAGPLAAAIYHMAAVLIIACPCAMGLATPVAIMAGANVAAERGILIRDALALEKTGQLSAVLFDKTGTLTRGKVVIAAVEEYFFPAVQATGFHKIAASLAKPSLHPLSQAVSGLSGATFKTNDWKEVRGSGIESRLEVVSSELAGPLYRLGSIAWLRECGVALEQAKEFLETWMSKGATVIGLAGDAQLLGLIAMSDQLKPDAEQVVRKLQNQGKAVYLVTGDNRRTATAIAQQAGIPDSHVFAEVRPEQKVAIVRQLQERGERVAFVGDGINDAPALEQADLGIAVSQATDVAREAADIILLKSDIRAVPESLALAHATLRTIKQNLFWAFFYNAAAVPLAVFGFVSPIVSALAMGLSDLIVIGNALRLRLWRSGEER